MYNCLGGRIKMARSLLYSRNGKICWIFVLEITPPHVEIESDADVKFQVARLLTAHFSFFSFTYVSSFDMQKIKAHHKSRRLGMCQKINRTRG